MDITRTSASKSVARHDKFIHFYCVKCRDHFKCNNYEFITFKNGKKAAKTICDKCNIHSFLILKKQ
jgi:hypothetical protein